MPPRARPGAGARLQSAAVMLAALLGCSSEPPGAVLAYVREDAGYAVAARALPALEDPGAVSGELGAASHGGRFAGEDYTGGAPLEVRYAVRDDVAVPLDRDGLLLWSFYGHLADARDALAARGVDIAPIFPVPLAWNPAVSPLFELVPSDNAAYAVGANLFLLLPDGDDRPVPLLANAGVVTHELGHALLHLQMRGDPLAEPLAPDTTTVAGQWQAAIHEGFADALAGLLLDDPAFLDPSLDLPARRLDGDAVLTEALLPSADEGAIAIVPTYDPYPLGSVIAAAAWDVREALDDPDRALALLLRGVDAWAPASTEDLDGERFLAAWVAAADEEEREALCAALDARFGSLLAAEGCE